MRRILFHCAVSSLTPSKEPSPSVFLVRTSSIGGRRIVMTSERNGKVLNFNVPCDDPEMQEFLGVLHHLLKREFQPLRRITIETINGEDAARSPYADPLRTAFEVTVDYKHLILYRKLI